MAGSLTDQLKALYKQEWEREPNRSANLVREGQMVAPMRTRECMQCACLMRGRLLALRRRCSRRWPFSPGPSS